jgi:hypothetical protein
MWFLKLQLLHLDMTYLDILAEFGALADSDPRSSASTPGTLAVRALPAIKDSSEGFNHHLWNNRGTWWCHFTLHRPDYTSERVRVSLRTRDVLEARRRRDQLLSALPREVR